MPYKVKNRFLDLRGLLSVIGVRVIKGAFQSVNFISGITGWKLGSNGLIEATRMKLENFIAYGDSSIVYSGTWSNININTLFGAGAKSSSTVGDTFTITFTGSSIGIVTEKATTLGKIDFSLDGGATTSVDLYSATSYARSVIYSQTGLGNKQHILVGTVATKNPSASANLVRLQGYVKSPTDGIKIDAISADLISIATVLTTDGNGYSKLGAPGLPSGYSSWAITGTRFATAVMSDAVSDPKISTIANAIYLYNGVATTSYAVLIEFLVSKT